MQDCTRRLGYESTLSKGSVPTLIIGGPAGTSVNNNDFSRRTFLRTAALSGASLAFSGELLSAEKRSVLLFTKSWGSEYDVVKTAAGQPSIVERAVRELGKKHGFEVSATKDGRIFDSSEFRAHSALVVFYHRRSDQVRNRPAIAHERTRETSFPGRRG